MRDLYSEVTTKIINDLASGVVPWVRPWNAAGAGMAYNAISKKSYRGINTLLLFAPQYESSAWMTYAQAQGVGAQVRKGERGSMIVFYKPFVIRDKNSEDSETRTIPLLRSFTVFNTQQIDNLPEQFAPVKIKPMPDAEKNEKTEKLLAQATILHGGNCACYSPSHDVITLPQSGSFLSISDYYATALHEMGHWTGHSSRLAREYGKRFGDQAYAREELVAELCASFLCAICEIPGKLQHSEYIANWIDIMKSDKRAVLMAASHAQKASDFILGIKPATEEAKAA